MKETLTCDADLGNGGRRLGGGKFTLRGGESDLSGVNVKLQPPRLVGGCGKPSVSFVRLTDEVEKLSTAAQRRRRGARSHPWWGPSWSNASNTDDPSRHGMRDGLEEHSQSTQVNTKTQNIA